MALRMLAVALALAFAAPAPMAAAQAAAKPQANELASEAWLNGAWRFNWQGAQGAYVGAIRVARSAKGLEAKVDVLRANDGAYVTQTARVEIIGVGVQIDGYEVTGGNTQGWSPDNFYLTRSGDRLIGYSVDDSGNRGTKIEVFR
ncbi:MAG: hypothetical protein AB7M12_04600 [Hyphomonadaceae bacterium]